MPILYTAINTSIHVDNKLGYLNDVIDLTATLKDEDGNPMAGETIIFSITEDPNTYTAITDNYGRATYTGYKIMQHTGFIYANFPGTIGYVASTGIGTLFLKPKPPTSTPKPIPFPHTTNQHPQQYQPYPVNASTVSMPSTGSPLAALMLGLLGIMGGTIYSRLR
ncbi:MAG: Ig-like domain-containing protein [Methanobacterium sp.]|nr:Ig-like domain-containing protein [Methanobacterium sp.]